MQSGQKENEKGRESVEWVKEFEQMQKREKSGFKVEEGGVEGEEEWVGVVRLGMVSEVDERVREVEREEGEEGVQKVMNVQGRGMRSGLMYCMYYGYKALVVYMLMKGASMFQVDEKGYSVFMWAAHFKRHHSLLLLTSHLLSSHRTHLSHQLNLIHKVKQSSNKTQVIQLATEYVTTKGDTFQEYLQMVDYKGRTVLHHACHSEQTLLVLLGGGRGARERIDEYGQVRKQLGGLVGEEGRRSMEVEDLLFTLIGKDWFRIQREGDKRRERILTDSINIQDNEGWTCLHVAAHVGDYKCVQLLLDKGADQSIRGGGVGGGGGKRAFELGRGKKVREQLGKRDQKEKIENAIMRGEHVDMKESIFGYTCLHQAVIGGGEGGGGGGVDRGREETLQMVIEQNCQMDRKDNNGWTALHHACQLGQMRTVQTLLQNGGSPLMTTNQQYLPLHLAAIHNQSQLVDLLLVPSSLINQRAHHQLTAVHLCAKHNSIAVLQILLNYSPDLYAVDHTNHTALHLATIHGHASVIRLLLNRDADAGILRQMKNNQGKMAKQLASNEHTRLAFLNVWHCSGEGDVDAVRMLLEEKGEPVDSQTPLKGNTPLILAVRKQHLSLVRYLLQRKANPNLTNHQSLSPLHYAKQTNNLQIIALLNK